MMEMEKYVQSESFRRTYLDQSGVDHDMIDSLEYYASIQDWDQIMGVVWLNKWHWLVIFETYYWLMPDIDRYENLISMYTSHGDEVGWIRKEMRKAHQYAPARLPKELAAQEVLTVYRAATEPTDKVRNSLSWTVNLNVAAWFRNYNRIHCKGESRIYKAKLKKDKVIAYTNDRKEEEIIQYRSVYDIEDITDQIPEGPVNYR